MSARLAGFYSDPHFGHRTIVDYCERPFTDLAHMHAELIARYNATIGPTEVCLWLGDCFFGPISWAADILAQMNGIKLLVRGNHDRSRAGMARIGFAVVTDSLTLCIAGQTVRACHLPWSGIDSREGAAERHDIGERPERAPGEWLLHGHTHSKVNRVGRAIHCGVDAWDYRPARMEEVQWMIIESGAESA